jgi:hypothetical protein
MSEAVYVSPEEMTRHENTEILIDNRPSDYEYALLSQHVYGGSALKKGDCLPDDEKWKIDQVKEGESGYFGAIYINDEIQQVVLAHRGTDSLKAILEDMRGILLNRMSPHKEEAFIFVANAINLVRDKKSYRLSFTGHSLGAFLAELSVFYAHDHFNFRDVNAVTFESPGSKESLEQMQSNLKRISLEQLDIVGYVSYPNLINTCNKHVGTLYHIKPNLGDHGWVPGWYTKKAHSIVGIIELFKGEVNNMPLRHCMSDWPLGSQKDIYFEHGEFRDGEYSLFEESMKEEEKSVEDIFSLTYKGHYRKDLSGLHVLALRHFSPNMQTFLRNFYLRISLIASGENISKLLRERWRRIKIPEEIIQYLQSYRVEKDSSGIEKVVLEVNELKSANVHHFRKELSNWLQESDHSIDELFNFPEKTNEHSRSLEEVRAEIKAPGIKVEKGGVLENLKKVGIHVDTSEGVSVQDIRNLKELSQEMPSATIKIDATIDAPNAVVSDGRITNVETTGALFTISARKKGTNTQLKDSPLESTPDHCDKGGATLRVGEKAEDPKRKSQSSTENDK